MKTLLLSSSLFLSLSLIPFAFSRQFPIFPPVFDVDGKELKLGAAYYVLSNAFLHPEGLCLVNVKSQFTSCPHDVVQCNLFYEPPLGLPLIFTSVDATEDAVVSENTFYKVQFSVAGNCSNETVWALVDAQTPNQKFIATDSDASSIQFQIQKMGLGYRITHCAFIPVPLIPICYPIGFISDGGYNRLGIGLGVNAAEFYFKSSATAVAKLATS